MGKRKRQPQYQKRTLRLKDSHTWKAPAGYKIVVLDRGVVSFNIPDTWIVAKTDPFELNDAPPPNDNARVTVSFWRLPPGVDWSGLPLAPLLAQSIASSERDLISTAETVTSDRTDLELVWTEQLFIDPVEKREAYSRIALARGWNVQALITSDFWADDRVRLTPIWDEVLRSLQLGRYIEDPTKGATLH